MKKQVKFIDNMTGNNDCLFTPHIRILWFVLAAMCLGYAMIVYMVGSGTFSFAIWLAGGGFFGLCFFLAGKGRWAAAPAALRYVSYVLLVVMAAAFLICQMAILSHFFDKGEDDLDYVIVLGAQMRKDGPSVIYRYRLEKAAEYLKDNPETICITTGGQGRNEHVSEGEGGAEYIRSLGISPDRVKAETLSEDTLENIQNALQIIESGKENTESLKIGIITNGFHVFRGIHIARGLTDAEICGIAAYMQPQYIPNNMVRETFGILRDFFKGLLKITI